MSLSATDLSTTTPCPRMQPPTTRAIRRQVVHGEVRRVASGATTGCSPPQTARLQTSFFFALLVVPDRCRTREPVKRHRGGEPGPGRFRTWDTSPCFRSIFRLASLPLFYLRIPPTFQKKGVPSSSQLLPLSKASFNEVRANSAPREVREHDAQKIHHDQDQRPRARRTRTRTDGKTPPPDDRTGVPKTN